MPNLGRPHSEHLSWAHRVLWFTIACLLFFGSAAQARPVAVRSGENGQGFLFAHGGTCYAVLPRHVAGNAYRAQIIAEDGTSGRASVRTPFWEGIDLAVAVLSRGPVRCEARLDDLVGQRGSVAQRAAAVLAIVDADGSVERLPMEIVEIGYLDLVARFTGPEAPMAQQGMSGGFLLVDGVPIGMAIDSAGGTSVRFMRVEEIHMNVSRWLSTQSAFDVAAAFGEDTAPALSPDFLALRLIGATAVATGPDTMAENLVVPEKAYVFEPSGPATIEFVIEGAAALSQMILISAPDQGEAIPRRILIQVNASEDGGRWRTFWSGDMPPDGLLDTGKRLPTSARRIRITISSAWASGPVRLDSVSAK
jgi:hypothetical protein